MYIAKVYTACIHSSGIVLEEEHIAREVFARWNVEEGEKLGAAYLVLPSNCKNIIPDINIFTIDNYVDEQTVETTIATGARMWLFFRSHHDEKNTLESEVRAIREFRGKWQSKCVCIDYSNNREFSQCLLAKLSDINNMV